MKNQPFLLWLLKRGATLFTQARGTEVQRGRQPAHKGFLEGLWYPITLLAFHSIWPPPPPYVIPYKRCLALKEDMWAQRLWAELDEGLMSLRWNLKTVTSLYWGKSSVYVNKRVFYELLVSFLPRWSFCTDKHPISSSLQGPCRLCQHFVIQHNGPQSFPVPLNYNKQEFVFLLRPSESFCKTTKSLMFFPLFFLCFKSVWVQSKNCCFSAGIKTPEGSHHLDIFYCFFYFCFNPVLLNVDMIWRLVIE